MGVVQQTTSDFKGDHLNVRMFGARGDLRFHDNGASIGAGSTALSYLPGGSPAPTFTPSDAGKFVMIQGAGAAGGNLEAQILAVLSPYQATISVAAGTGVTSAVWGYGSDDTAAINAAIRNNVHIEFSDGNFLVRTPIVFQDVNNIRFFGHGQGSVLVASPNFTDNMIKILGSVNVEISDFQIQGYFYPPNISNEIIIGDGSTKNPAYGFIRVARNNFFSCPPICVGIGATTGNTAYDVTIEDNNFIGCSSGNSLPNTIDTGSTGTKLRYKIRNNRFEWGTGVSQPVAIFAGHGIQTDCEITNNQIFNYPIDGIQVYGRSFSTETVSLEGYLVSGNIVHNCGHSGIAVLGCSGALISNNVIVNPGQAMTAHNEERCGIFLSNGTSGGPTGYYASAQIHVVGNSIVDYGTGGMLYAIYESTQTTGHNTTGTIQCNMSRGNAVVSDISQLGSMTIFHAPGFSASSSSQQNFIIGTGSQGAVPFPTDQLNIMNNVQLQSPLNALTREDTMLPTSLTGNHLIASAWNLHFDGTNWISGNDTVNNGAAVIASDYGTGGLKIYAVPTTGGSNQTISPTNLENYWQVTVEPASTTRSTLIGGGFVTDSLKATPSDFFWSLGNDGTQGTLRVANGSNAGGIDGHGSAVYGLGSSGLAATILSAGSAISGSVALQVTGTAVFFSLSANSPLKLDGSHNVIAAKIDLGSSSDITGTGLSSNQVLTWSGSAVTGVTGVTTTISNFISAPTGTFITSVNFVSQTTTSGSAVIGINVASHNVTNGIVTS